MAYAFHEESFAPSDGRLTTELSVIVGDRGDKLVTIAISDFDEDGDQVCDHEVTISSRHAADFARKILEGVKVAAALDEVAA